MENKEQKPMSPVRSEHSRRDNLLSKSNHSLLDASNGVSRTHKIILIGVLLFLVALLIWVVRTILTW